MRSATKTSSPILSSLDLLPTGCLVLSSDMRIAYWNRCIESWTGRSRMEMLGDRIGDHYPHLNGTRYASRLERIFRGGPPEIFSSTLHHAFIPCTLADGREQAQDTVVSGFRYEACDSFMAMVTIRDVSQIVDACGACRKVVDKTESEIREWVALESNLQAAEMRAADAEKLRSQFFDNMNHEIRTPMNGVIGMAELLRQTDLDEEQAEYVDIIRLSGEKLLTIVNDILDFSSLEAGELRIEEVPFHLRSSVDDALRPFALESREKGIALACRVDDDLPDHLLGDAGRIRQILSKLLGNALKFTYEGRIDVRLSGAFEEDHSGELIIVVQDTGIGIPREKLAVIFEPFRQGDGSTSRAFGGTGLGLAIVHRLIKTMGGDISVKSAPSAGTTFRVAIPASRPQEEEPTHERDSDRSLEGFRLLIVGDDLSDRAAIEQILLPIGVSTSVVDGGASAMRQLTGALESGEPFSVLVVSSTLADCDSYDFVAGLRSHPDFESLRIIVVAGPGIRGDSAKCRECGADAYLTTPYLTTDLVDAIREVIEQADCPSKRELVTRHTLREHRGSYRILVVEDSSVCRRLISVLLERRGHTVSTAENGRIALDRLKSEDFDLVLMDGSMPELDGWDATTSIRKREAGSEHHLPIIALTMKDHLDSFLTAGVDDFAIKPVVPEELFETIQRVMSLRLATSPE